LGLAFLQKLEKPFAALPYQIGGMKFRIQDFVRLCPPNHLASCPVT
jgi:hypothetical protein